MRYMICANDRELGQASQILERLLSMYLGRFLDSPRLPSTTAKRWSKNEAASGMEGRAVKRQSSLKARVTGRANTASRTVCSSPLQGHTHTRSWAGGRNFEGQLKFQSAVLSLPNFDWIELQTLSQRGHKVILHALCYLCY